MLAMDSLVSIISWIPLMTLLFDPYILPEDKYKLGNVICNIMVLSNCFSTPILYFLFNKDFKVCYCFMQHSKLI